MASTMADDDAPDDATVVIAVAQFAPGADGDANIAEIRRLTGRAADRGARLVVFPEYSSGFVDPFDDTLVRHAQRTDGAFVAALARVAAEHGVHIVAGMLEAVADDHRVHNTLVAVDGEGLRARYRKLHLYDAFGQRESDWIVPGAVETPQTFVVDGIRCGMQTCYDVRFPEVSRALADAGADVAVIPAQWVRGPLKEHHWRTLLTARAIENTMYVAAADHVPPKGIGCSLILDPEGVVLAGLGIVPDVATAVVRRADIARVRRTNPALALRRFTVAPRR